MITVNFNLTDRLELFVMVPHHTRTDADQRPAGKGRARRSFRLREVPRRARARREQLVPGRDTHLDGREGGQCVFRPRLSRGETVSASLETVSA